MIQSNLSERLALVSRIAPQSVDGATVTSAYVAPAVLAKFSRLIAIAQLGENSTGDVTVSLIKASDGSGSGATAVATATVLAGAAADNKDVILDFDVNDIDDAKPYMAMRVTVSTSTCLVSAVMLGGDSRYEPASDHNAASVAQVVD